MYSVVLCVTEQSDVVKACNWLREHLTYNGKQVEVMWCLASEITEPEYKNYDLVLHLLFVEDKEEYAQLGLEICKRLSALPPTASTEITIEKSQEISILEENSKNNGGTTNYYDLPLPDKEEIKNLIYVIIRKDGPSLALKEYIDKFLELYPNTLNDLIEHKNMPFWRGEILKACYGLEGRMEKNKEPEKAEERELNKIIYYANRRLKMIRKR